MIDVVVVVDGGGVEGDDVVGIEGISGSSRGSGSSPSFSSVPKILKKRQPYVVFMQGTL